MTIYLDETMTIYLDETMKVTQAKIVRATSVIRDIVRNKDIVMMSIHF